jgi:hypothetical protein
VDLASKLQIKAGQSVAVVGAPESLSLALPDGCTAASDPARADVVIAFVRLCEDVAGGARPAIDAGRDDRLAWVAYPKAGNLGTDLNRDRLRDVLLSLGVQPVRQVAIDEVWSALRVRPC